MYRCSTPSDSSQGSPAQSVGTPVQTKSYQGVFEPNNTAQAPSTNGSIQYARTPVLEAGQVVHML